MTGNVRLLCASGVIAHGKAGGILARRQDLPDEAFIGVEELQRIFGEGNKDDVLPIIAISFCWATPAHPDPDGSQLRTIVEVLEREMKKYATAEMKKYATANKRFKGFADMWASSGMCAAQ
eukprot:3113974-Prymnesium_polylepis.1